MPRSPRTLIQKLQRDYDQASVMLRIEVARIFPPGTMVECMDHQWGAYKVIGSSGLYPGCVELERMGHVSWSRLSVVDA